MVQLPNLGAGCGFCVLYFKLRDGGVQLAYRASSVSAGPAGMHLEELSHEGNVHVNEASLLLCMCLSRFYCVR